jgi:hypothetical protein
MTACAGVCVDLNASAQNCGSCGTSCSSRSCAGGVCQ